MILRTVKSKVMKMTTTPNGPTHISALLVLKISIPSAITLSS